MLPHTAHGTSNAFDNEKLRMSRGWRAEVVDCDFFAVFSF